jgi:hypothetical protein
MAYIGDGDESNVDKTELHSDLLQITSQTDNFNDIRQINNHFNDIHGLLLKKDKIKNVININNELESSLK